MADDKQTTQQNPPSYLQYPTGYPMQPIFYVPQASPYVTPINEEQEKLVTSENQENMGGCRRRWFCRRRSDGCCGKDDGRAFGSFSHFITTLTVGTIAPVLSLLLVFGMETSKLARVGVVFGTANSFLIAAACIFAWIRHHGQEYQQSHVHLLVPLILGLVLLLIAVKCWKRTLYHYRNRQNKSEDELVKVISLPGTCCQYAVTFLVSLLIPLLGVVICLIARRRYLFGRYGALSGFGAFLVIAGIVGTFHGIPPISLVAGLFVMQLSLVHFGRTIACAQATQPTQSSCP